MHTGLNDADVYSGFDQPLAFGADGTPQPPWPVEERQQDQDHAFDAGDFGDGAPPARGDVYPGFDQAPAFGADGAHQPLAAEDSQDYDAFAAGDFGDNAPPARGGGGAFPGTSAAAVQQAAGAGFDLLLGTGEQRAANAVAQEGDVPLVSVAVDLATAEADYSVGLVAQFNAAEDDTAAGDAVGDAFVSMFNAVESGPAGNAPDAPDAVAVAIAVDGYAYADGVFNDDGNNEVSFTF